MPNIYEIADGNWHLWRAWSVVGQRTSAPQTRIPLQILSWFCEYALRLKATHGAIAFDGPDNFRYDIYKDYKGSRSGEGGGHDTVVNSGPFQGMTAADAVYSLLPPTVELFRSVGIMTIISDRHEADDCLSSAGHKYGVQSNHVYLVTRDKDMTQCVNKNVTVYIPPMQQKPEILLTSDSTPELKKGLTPKQFLEYQILMGDPMDDVPAVSAVNERQVLNILKTHGSLSSYFKTKEGRAFYDLRISELHRNKTLVGLSKKVPLPDSKLLSFSHLRGSAESKSFTTLRDLQKKASLW
jgi:5'-3' exonuclease